MHPRDPSPFFGSSTKIVLAPLAQALAAAPWRHDSLLAILRAWLPRPLVRSAKPLLRGLLAAFPGRVAPDAPRLLRHLRQTPHASRITAHARRLGQRPAPVLSPPRFSPPPFLSSRPPGTVADLPVLETPGDLADFLAITPEQLVRFADLRSLSALSPDPFGPHYLHHLIPKPAGGHRLIEEPRPFLKKLQRRLLSGLLDRVPPHEAAFGFRKGHNCIMAAARHAGEAVVLGFDLADFFPTLDFARIYGIFRALGYPAAVARDLAGLTTVRTPASVLRGQPGLPVQRLRHRHLPQGAPTSPALANLAAFRLDCRLAGLARSLGAGYSRYADDLAFSGDRRIAAPLLRVLPEIVRQEGFVLNPAKTRLLPRHRAQRITGLVVNAHVNLPRADYDRLKATLHHLRDPADPRRGDPAFLAALSGRISWAEQVNPARGARLRAAFSRIHG